MSWFTRDDNANIITNNGVTTVFQSNVVYTVAECETAIGNVGNISDTNFFVGATGYSDVADLGRYGITEEFYRFGVKAVMTAVTKMFRRKLSNLTMVVSHGASDMGVDAALLEHVEKYSLHDIGFSCAAYAKCVPDNGMPLVISEDSETYSRLFVESLDVLLVLGGRKQAYLHDTTYAKAQNVRRVYLDLPSLLAGRHVPGETFNEAGELVVQNAAAAELENTRNVSVVEIQRLRQVGMSAIEEAARLVADEVFEVALRSDKVRSDAGQLDAILGKLDLG